MSQHQWSAIALCTHVPCTNKKPTRIRVELVGAPFKPVIVSQPDAHSHAHEHAIAIAQVLRQAARKYGWYQHTAHIIPASYGGAYSFAAVIEFTVETQNNTPPARLRVTWQDAAVRAFRPSLDIVLDIPEGR